MRPLLHASVAHLAGTRLATRPCSHGIRASRACIATTSSRLAGRSFTTSHIRGIEKQSDASYSQPAENLSHNVTQQEQEHFDQRVMDESKHKQIQTPWHREGSDKPPVARQRSAGAMTKGKLLTTPSRMLKLILPLTTRDANSDRKDVEPLALLVHPQQPLSYLERLIQSELPLIEKNGKERVPEVYFRAEDSMQTSLQPKGKKRSSEEKDEESEDGKAAEDGEAEQDKEHAEEHKKHKDRDESQLSNPDKMNIDGESIQTGKLNRRSPEEASELRGGPGEGGVESYSGLGQDRGDTAGSQNPDEKNFVRWSSSTEIGDFIRDAARGTEFALEIEGAPQNIYVGVPSFNDRTYYLRMRLRSTSKKISSMASVKHECEAIAHRHAQRVAFAGFGGLCGWWYLVYRLTFETELGWDVMEPVTYLVGLSTLIAGYIWFLYHNREVSYRSAMNITISRRLSKLYENKGFDQRRWEGLIEEGNALRKEIKAVANEYDVEWDELQDEKDEKVHEALRKEREKRKKGGKKGKKEDDDDD